MNILFSLASVMNGAAPQTSGGGEVSFFDILSDIGAKLAELIRFGSMDEVAEKLRYYLLGDDDFGRNALIVGILVALCSSLLGVTLVLKRFSFIGDGLSHAAFGAMAVAAILGLAKQRMLLILPATILTAVLLLRPRKNAKIAGDAGLAMISVGALGIGYLLMNLFPPKSGNVSADVCSTLFGSTSILTLKEFDVWLCVIMSVVVVVWFVLCYNRIFAVTFDEVFASATGMKANLYNMLIAIITAAIIVLAMNLVGSLLISALVVFPALSAMRIFKSFRSVVICAAGISVFNTTAGILFAMLKSTPVGSTIVVFDLLIFLIFCLIGKFMQK